MPIAIENLEGGSTNKFSPGEFFNHVFNFDSDNKALASSSMIFFEIFKNIFMSVKIYLSYPNLEDLALL